MMKRTAIVAAVAVLVLGAAVLLSSIGARRTPVPDPKTCVNHLRAIASAKKAWAERFNKTTNDTPSWSDISRYLWNPQATKCPDGGTYILGAVGEPPRCSLAPAVVGGRPHELPR